MKRTGLLVTAGIVRRESNGKYAKRRVVPPQSKVGEKLRFSIIMLEAYSKTFQTVKTMQKVV
jgi:hypothetical protein